MGFWKALLGFSLTARITFGISLMVGFTLLGVGLWGELLTPSWWPKDEWKKLGYGLNVLASFTSFLIGLPFALVILETIKSSATEKQQIDGICRISRVAWHNFSNAIHELCTNERITAIYDEGRPSLSDQVIDQHDQILNEIESCRDRLSADPSTRVEQINQLKTVLAGHSDTYGINENRLNVQLGTEDTLRPLWNNILSFWQILDTHVRLRRMEFGLDLIDPGLYARLLNQLTSPNNPLFLFVSMNYARLFGQERNISTSKIHGVLTALIGWPNEEVFNTLYQSENWVSQYRIPNTMYKLRATDARKFLESLRDTVDEVTRSGWPG